MNVRLILGGLKSYWPIPPWAYKGTGGTTSGRYCYAVWMRHLSLVSRHVHPFRPRVVVELGPGDSIGLGLAALLGGAEAYHGLDVLAHASVETNERVLLELVDLFRDRASIPDDFEFPHLLPVLSRYDRPASLFEDQELDQRLSVSSVSRLRSAIREMGTGTSPIRYSCPWSAESVNPASADLIISHGALQDMDHHPGRDDLHSNLAIMAGWLVDGGVMSHHIDLGCPGGTPWNHHWAYGSFTWKLIRGKRPYYKNRVPLSEYLRLFKALGCDVVGVETTHSEGLSRDRLAPPFCDLPDADLTARAALIVAVKR